MKYIGIDGCKKGWFIVGLDEYGEASYTILNKIDEFESYLPVAEQVLLDIPIGLRREHPDERLCDKQARAALQPKRGPSVFPAPSRCALGCDNYEEASKQNRACTGRGLSKQSYAIIPKIREVDQFLQKSTAREKIREMHPEICFWALNNQNAMEQAKKTNEGYEARVALLNKHYSGSRDLIEMAMQQYKRKDVARDDIVDALVGAVTARNYKLLQQFPEIPDMDEFGLDMEIVYWLP